MPVSNQRQTFEESLKLIGDLKSRIQRNINDEEQAQKTYSEQLRLAQKVGKASVEFILKDIAIQESRHAEMFRKALKELEQKESEVKKKIEEIKKEEDRRKKEEDQRVASIKNAERQRREADARKDREILEGRRRGR